MSGLGPDLTTDAAGRDTVEIPGDDHRPGQIGADGGQGLDLTDLAPLELERPGPGQVNADDVQGAQRSLRHGGDVMQAVGTVVDGGQKRAAITDRAAPP